MRKIALVCVSAAVLMACAADQTDGPSTAPPGSPANEDAGPARDASPHVQPPGPMPGVDGGSQPGSDAAAPVPSSGDAGDPYGTPPQCTSNKTWILGDIASAEMHPGVACDTCHTLGGSATKYMFDVAGTVYPTAHEPNDCYGATGASVVITDAKGTDHTLAVNGAGNFYNFDYVGLGAIPTPYSAKVVYNGKERAMISTATSGDCNSCHTENGAMNAPGRIMLP